MFAPSHLLGKRAQAYQIPKPRIPSKKARYRDEVNQREFDNVKSTYPDYSKDF